MNAASSSPVAPFSAQQDDEDYGETFLMDQNWSSMQQQPVLKRAASAFIDMLATSSSMEFPSNEQPNSGNNWTDSSLVKSVGNHGLDLNVPPLIDCGCAGQDYSYEVGNHGDTWLQYLDGTYIPDDVFSQKYLLEKMGHDDPIFSGGLLEAFSPKVCKQGTGTGQSASQQASLETGQSYTEQARVAEVPLGIHEEARVVEDTHEQARVAEVPVGIHEEGTCTSDCPVLVNTICNLSKVLLAHYESQAPGSVSELQVAVLNLSQCLLHAHGAAPADEKRDEEINQPILPSKAALPVKEEDAHELESSNEDEDETDEDEMEEAVFSRLRALIQARETLTGKSPVDKPHSNDQGKTEESIFYLNPNQVEERLALLKSRPNLTGGPPKEGATTVTVASDEQIQVDNNYIGNTTKNQQIEEDEATRKKAVVTERILFKTETEAAADEKLLSSDGEESGWEHV